jgi:hypothetical protein
MAYSLPLKETYEPYLSTLWGLDCRLTPIGVTTEEERIALLDIIVCSFCFMESQRVRLHAVLEANRPPLGAEGVNSRLGI